MHWNTHPSLVPSFFFSHGISQPYISFFHLLENGFCFTVFCTCRLLELKLYFTEDSKNVILMIAKIDQSIVKT